MIPSSFLKHPPEFYQPLSFFMEKSEPPFFSKISKTQPPPIYKGGFQLYSRGPRQKQADQMLREGWVGFVTLDKTMSSVI